MMKSEIKLMIYASGKNDIEVIIDSLGIKMHNGGEYRRMKYKEKREWQKIHIVIERKTHKILNIIVTGNEVGDIREFLPLLKPIKKRNRVRKVIADGAYDSENNFRHCDEHDTKPLIPVHISATGRHGRHRRKRVIEQLNVDRTRGKNFHKIPSKEKRIKSLKIWKNKSGYHQRSLVENSFSVFKGVFGEYTFSKRKDIKEKNCF